MVLVSVTAELTGGVLGVSPAPSTSVLQTLAVATAVRIAVLVFRCC
jgi:hypothetical protein